MAACPPVDAFVRPDESPLTDELLPMDLYLCADCGHAQLLDVVSPQVLFGNYIYTTTSSPGLVEYFRKYASDIYYGLKLGPNSKVLDIGSNDGTLLAFFKAFGLQVMGVDPAEKIASKATASGLLTIAKFFTEATAIELFGSYGGVDVVTANNVFAHSDDLADMLKGVRAMLLAEGTFVFEVSYLLDLVEGKVFDFIYHEHLSHHSVRPLKLFMERHGMKLVNVERTSSKGGSIRCFAKLGSSSAVEEEAVAKFIELENSKGLYDLTTYRALTREIESIGNSLRARLSEFHSSGKRMAAYGASATGTVLLHYFDIGKYFHCLIDDNPDRQGRLSPGHRLPVVASNMQDADHPDVVVVLAWRFSDRILGSEFAQLFRANGGRFIVPLPAYEEF
jgi:SAM-dependent methyltransferase